MSLLFRKPPISIRHEAAQLALDWARERQSCGDPEGAECFRMLAREIKAIRLLAPKPKP